MPLGSKFLLGGLSLLGLGGATTGIVLGSSANSTWNYEEDIRKTCKLWKDTEESKDMYEKADWCHKYFQEDS